MLAVNDNTLHPQTHADHVDRAQLTSAADLQAWLNDLATQVDLSTTYLITGRPFEHIRSASLTVLTLTDGSTVHDIWLD